MITETKQKTMLAAPEGWGTAELVQLINARVQPNRPLGEGDVFIRRMFLASNRINSFGGRFDKKELAKMGELAEGSPVLVGHNHQKLPIARNFKADLVEKMEETWLAVHFYWLADSDGALNLLKNIDGGIYKEVSAAFLFELPECSVCGRDIRICEHIPFRRYAVPNGSLAPAFFWYRNVTKLLETSLVYRGAVPGTKITVPLAGRSEQNQELFTTKTAERKNVPSRRKRLHPIYGR
ncbi:MAG: hypothetical protein L0196_07625 [candidate division Zixibacteria bacterium]|nr:hypothetical protein [candidate division Zixibacteria bacterium]